MILNIIIPLLSGAFLSLNSKFNPMGKYTELSLASTNIESEIYKYRSKVGVYNTLSMIEKQ
jgi:hypothetical protein